MTSWQEGWKGASRASHGLARQVNDLNPNPPQTRAALAEPAGSSSPGRGSGRRGRGGRGGGGGWRGGKGGGRGQSSCRASSDSEWRNWNTTAGSVDVGGDHEEKLEVATASGEARATSFSEVPEPGFSQESLKATRAESESTHEAQKESERGANSTRANVASDLEAMSLDEGSRQGSVGKAEGSGASPAHQIPVEHSLEEIMRQMEGLDLKVVAELSADERAQNEQEQQDEVEALEAIYAEDFCLLDRPPGCARAFSVSVRVELAGPIQVTAKLPDLPPSVPLSVPSPSVSTSTLPVPSRPPSNKSSATDSASASSPPSTSYSTSSETASSIPSPSPSPSPSSREVHRFFVEHLPPLHLLCVLPASYPSRCRPLFRLSALWLNARQLARLCDGLDALWVELGGGAPEGGGGQVVGYSFVDWLSRECLSHLGLEHELELGPYGNGVQGEGFKGAGFGGDLRAVPEGRSLEEDVPRLLRWDEERRAEAFLGGLHTCLICFGEQPGSDFVRIPCGHHFCAGCMRTFAEGHVADGSIASLTCPDTTCRGALPPGVLRALLSPEAFSRWEALTLQRTLDAMTDLAYCPRCGAAALEDSASLAQCPQCFFAFCGLCREGWHAGRACVDAEGRLRIMQERRKGQAAGAEQARREQALAEEVRSLQLVQREAQRCPQCGMAISKSEGCNKMTCANCGAFFCYRCGKAIEGYDHFRSGSCVLFEAAEVARWEQQMQQQRPPMAEEGLFARAAVEMWPERRRLCPLCRQENYKEGNNNHMACWACRNHFCGLCGKGVRSSAEHYGPNKCKQHTR